MAREEYGSRLEHLLRQRYPDYGTEAHINVLVRKAKDVGLVNNVPNMIKFLDGNVDVNRNTLAPLVNIAYGEAETEHKHYDFSSTGLVRRVLNKTRELGFDTTNPRDLADVMDWLIKNEGVPLSTEGQRYEQQLAQSQIQAKEAQKTIDYVNAMIQNIARGKDRYPMWDASHGEVKDRDSAELYNLTIPELEQRDREVAALRQRRFDMDKDQQREALHDVANANRVEYNKDGSIKRQGFDNRCHSDSLGEIHNPNSGPERAYTADPTASPIQGHRTASSTDPFMSAATGRELTRREAITLSKTNLAEFARLSKLDKLRLNRILAQ